MEAAFSMSDYLAQIDRLNRVPREDRWQYIPIIGADGERTYPTFAGEQHADDIEFARKTMAGMPADSQEDAPRIINVQVKRPYRARAAIIAEVSAWATELLGKNVSLRQVDSAWRLLRSATAEGSSL